MRNILDLSDLTPQAWEKLYKLCDDIMTRPSDYSDSLRGRVMASLFYEPSTRTNLSFQAAMQRLGGSVFGFTDPTTSSVSKGETLKDTVVMTSGYADVLVMRHPCEGAARAASLYSSVPVINAGDGGHMHPTQTLADLTTITKYRGKIDGINIGLCGDLKYGRTVHSLIGALENFKNITFYMISPRELAVPQYVRDSLKEKNIRFYESSNLDAAMPSLDVLYMTRIQQERFVDPLEYERLKGVYVLDGSKLKRAKKDMIILHPLPRVDEISPEVDDDPRARYFDQARCGMFIRMALLLSVTACGRRRPDLYATLASPRVCTNPRCITARESYLPPLTIVEGESKRCLFCENKI